MAGIAMLFYGLTVVVLVAGVWLSAHRHEAPRADDAVVAVMRAARRRTVVAVGFALLLLLVGVITAVAVPEWFGLGSAVSPTIAGIGGLGLYAATPPSQDDRTQTLYCASVEPRQPWTIAPSASLASLGGGLLLLLGLLTFTGATSTVDDHGLYRAITFATDKYSSTATPYPGWFYAAPLMVTTVLLTASVWIALRRIATTSSLPGPGLENIDRLWRVTSAQIVVGLAFAAVSLQFGSVAILAGATMGNAQVHAGRPAGGQVLATCLVILGVGAMIVSIVNLTLAALRAFTLPRHASSLRSSERYEADLPTATRGRA